MRSIQVEKVRDAVRDMCIEANYSLSPDMRCVFEKACQEEKSPLGRQILNQLSENLEIAKKDEIPICQDTGMAVVFLEVGQEVHFEGGSLEEAVQEGTIESKILGIEEILAEYPRVCCTKEGDRLLANGNPLVQALVDAQEKNGWIRMCSSEGSFAGVYQWDEKRNRYFPVKMF